MAEVHLGLDTGNGDAVAIKRLRPDLADDDSARALFDAEARTSSLLGHPGVVQVIATGEDEGDDESGPIPYIAMELVRGRTLRSLVRQKRLPVRRALAIVGNLLEALGHVHACGLVHRDIKPGNIMITDHGVKLMDFGIARPVGAPAGIAGYGTAKYLSPEQAHEEPADARSDLYAAACVLYELLTGRPPFVAAAPADIVALHLVETPLAPSALGADVSPELDAVVLRALAKAPDERYASAAMRAALDAVPDGRDPAPDPVPVITEPELVWDPPAPLVRGGRTGRAMLAAPLAAVLFLAATCGLSNVFGIQRAQGDVAIAAALVVAPQLGRVSSRPEPAPQPTANGGTGQAAYAPPPAPKAPAPSAPSPRTRPTRTADPAIYVTRTAKPHRAKPAAQKTTKVVRHAKKAVKRVVKHTKQRTHRASAVKRHVVRTPVVRKPVASKPTTSKPTTSKPTTPKPSSPKPSSPKPTSSGKSDKIDKVKKRIEAATKDVEKTKSEIKKVVDDVLSKLGH